MESILLIGGIVLAYFVGSIPTSVWFGRWTHKIDIREHGSGNAGATNTIRVLGWKVGVPVLLFDVFKGWLAVYLHNLVPLVEVKLIDPIVFQIILAIAAVLGHIFPVFAGFRGGKGVATLLGVAIALYPYSILLSVGVFLLSLLLTRIVSISSIITAICFPIIVYFIFGEQHTFLIGLSILIGIFVPITHHKNIGRMIRGEEKRIRLKRS